MKAMRRKIDRVTVELKPSSYQPSKAELEADVSIDADPEDLARAVLQQVRIESVGKP